MFNLPENTRRSAVARWLDGALCSAAAASGARRHEHGVYLCSAACWLLSSCSLVACTSTGAPHGRKPGTSSLQAWRLALARVRNLELETRESERETTSREPERPQGRCAHAAGRRGTSCSLWTSGPGLLGHRSLGLGLLATGGPRTAGCWPLFGSTCHISIG
jgi:hypothetical protein